jgi:dihydroxyacid dehydratase/phosphogluconate dehydratase
MPKVIEGSLIALVKDRDKVIINSKKRVVNLDILAGEMERRRLNLG